MSEAPSAATWRGDIAGGITAAILALPESMAYGTIVFAPLGANYSSAGVLAGLAALVFANLGAAQRSGVRIMNNGPFSLSSLMLASVLAIILENYTSDPTTALTLLFLVAFMSGLLQVIFGALKLGNLAKFIPYPVTAGLLNGTYILLFLGQLRPMLGLTDEGSLFDFAYLREAFQPATLIVGLVTVAVILFSPRISKNIPAVFMGITAGIIAYYGFFNMGMEDQLGPVIGSIPISIPKPEYALNFFSELNGPLVLSSIQQLLPLSAGIALVVSLRTLVVSVAADNVAQRRSDTNRELMGQGFGNMLSALFGGITSAGSASRSIANFKYGGRSTRSRIVSGVFALIVLVFLGPLVAQMPKVILAGTLVVLAVTSFDKWTLNLIRRFVMDSKNRRDMVADLVTVVTVTVVLVFVGIFESLGVGILLALTLLIYRMSRGTVRKDYSAGRVRSNADRSREELMLLEKYGSRIKIVELEGSIFFGTADKLADRLNPSTLEEIDYIVLDFRRVSDIDSTGANLLVQLKKEYDRTSKILIFSGIDLRKSYNTYLKALGILEKIGRNKIFRDVDDALIWCEDRLLDNYLERDRYGTVLSLEHVEALSQFTEEEVETFGGFCKKQFYIDKQTIFKQGDASDRIFIILQGRVNITIYPNLEDPDSGDRIATLGPGTLLGEMGALDSSPRAASAISNGICVFAVLTIEDLERLKQEHPEIAFKFMVGLGQELAKRLRIMNMVATELKA